MILTANRILVPRGRAPFGQHQESRPLAVSNNGSPRFRDLPSICACSGSSLTNLIGSGLNLWRLQIHSKPECRWTWPEVAILGADQKERGLWGRECANRRTARNSNTNCKQTEHVERFINTSTLCNNIQVSKSQTTPGVINTLDRVTLGT